MLITSSLPVSLLLKDHPWAAEVLAWHGVLVDELDGRMSIAALCCFQDLDEDRLLRDLAAAGRSREAVSRDTAAADGLWGTEAAL